MSDIQAEIHFYFSTVFQIFEHISDDIPPQYGYPHSNALVTFVLQNYSENVVCCAYVQRLPAA